MTLSTYMENLPKAAAIGNVAQFRNMLSGCRMPGALTEALYVAMDRRKIGVVQVIFDSDQAKCLGPEAVAKAYHWATWNTDYNDPLRSAIETVWQQFNPWDIQGALTNARDCDDCKSLEAMRKMPQRESVHAID